MLLMLAFASASSSPRFSSFWVNKQPQTCGHPLTLSPARPTNARNRSLVVWTAPFLRDTCITLDSISTHNFSLYPTLPFSVAPDNTVLLLNASEMLCLCAVKLPRSISLALFLSLMATEICIL
ncbi:hypothetical protein KP509_08G053700 [Ceratopteris richardii]|uniref:Uncharacterized protein n=1 Tax=Ceratopteris richardii TaxID=49495 RepID=A0A8T2UCA2_CERRI|nr:hypothetical protein KP509_08G053700 [Ceratopteris richardii]